jgi:hypothetical protein
MPDGPDGCRGWLLTVPFHGRPLALAFGTTRAAAWERAVELWRATGRGGDAGAVTAQLRRRGARCVRAVAAPEADWDALVAVAHDAREESSMYARGLAEGAAAEREACCKAVCSDCAAGKPVRWQEGLWVHPLPDLGIIFRRCRADAIRRRAEDDGRCTARPRPGKLNP